MGVFDHQQASIQRIGSYEAQSSRNLSDSGRILTRGFGPIRSANAASFLASSTVFDSVQIDKRYSHESLEVPAAAWLLKDSIAPDKISTITAAVDGHADGPSWRAPEGARTLGSPSVACGFDTLASLVELIPHLDISKRNRSKGFAIYRGVPSIRQTFPDPRPAWERKQLARLDPTGARTRLFARDAPDCAKVGDVLMVTTKTGEPFAGVCISIRRRGIDSAILLRGQLTKVGVEMWFKIYSPFVVGIDIVWRRPKRARRARLTYMRQPKHDMGSVENMVFAWKRERAKLRGKGRAQGHGLETRFEP